MTTPENCCERRGLYYADGAGSVCSLHQTIEQQDMLLESTLRCGPALSGHEWPYGPNINVHARLAMLDWADTHNLRIVSRTHHCPRWLVNGACRRTAYGCDGTLHPGGWVDHVTAWVDRDTRKPVVVVAQPYVLSAESRMQVQALCVQHGLRAEVHDDGWYRFGAHFVGLWAPGRE